jgi:hypothetical protein
MRPTSRCSLLLLRLQTRSRTTARCRASGDRQRGPATWRGRGRPFRWRLEKGRRRGREGKTVRKKKGRCGRKNERRFSSSISLHLLFLPAPNPLRFDPKPVPETAGLPHSAMSAAVPMEKSLIDGEAGNDELLGFALFDCDDAKPPPASLLLLLFPPSPAEERCESRRMSEDMVSR